VSAITNASPAVATSTAHGYANGDEFLLSSGWEDATDSIYRAANQSTNAFDIEGLDTTDTSWFAAGGGTGTALKVSSWLAIPQVVGISSSGGDGRFTQVQPLSRRNATQIPTGFNPSSITLTLGHDAAAANFATMLAVSRTRTKIAFKVVLGGGARMYSYGYMGVNEIPTLNAGQVNQVQCVVTVLGRVISYAS
jgi:hypothetical protein